MFPGCVMLPQTLRSIGRQTPCGLCHGEPSGLSGRRTKPMQVECATSHQDADNGHWSQGRFPGWVNQSVGDPARISSVMAPTLPTHLILATGSIAHLFLSVLHCKPVLSFQTFNISRLTLVFSIWLIQKFFYLLFFIELFSSS